MNTFIPDTDKTITLPVGIDFREPGQPSPYRDREAERQARKDGINESLRNALNAQCSGSVLAQIQRQSLNDIFGGIRS